MKIEGWIYGPKDAPFERPTGRYPARSRAGQITDEPVVVDRTEIKLANGYYVIWTEQEA